MAVAICKKKIPLDFAQIFQGRLFIDVLLEMDEMKQKITKNVSLDQLSID